MKENYKKDNYNMGNKVKIFVTYKDRHRVIQTDIIQPIQTGRAIADEIFEDMIGDDTGDNISIDNPKYNELSAMYWVWKHYEEIGNPEYVGFMHYRRHFIFDNTFSWEDKDPLFPGMCCYKVNSFDNEVINNLKTDKVLNTLSDNPDCLVVKKYDIRNLTNNNLYMREHYINTIPGAKRQVWNAFYRTVKKLYPEYSKIMDNFTYGHSMNCFNMFIMKKDLFFRCAEFYFNILKEVDKQIDSKNFTAQELRFCGYIGEYILTLFVMKLEENRNYYIKPLDTIFIENTDWIEIIKNKSFWKYKLLSLSQTPTHKTFSLLGIRLKFRKRTSTNQLMSTLARQERMLNILTNKVSELQEEILKKELINNGK